MNESLAAFGFAGWKPVLTSLLLPPTPLLLLLLFRALLPRRRPVQTRWVCGSVAILIWLTSCTAIAEQMGRSLLRTIPALTITQIAELRSHAAEPVAIVILGGGTERWAPEYRDSSLASSSLERLRYGIWLSRQTGWPVAFSGGTGWGQPPPPASAPARGTAETTELPGSTIEASIAERIAADEWGMQLRWIESSSRDTRENAVNAVSMLHSKGIRRILLVTHQWHMSRAMHNFESVARGSIRIDAAPMGMARKQEMSILRWMPSGEGLTLARQVTRERLGLLFGA